jgi:tetratricopeptide (TPR) repeat protein
VVKKTTMIFLSLISVILLAGVAVGSVLLKTSNKDFAKDPAFYRSLGNEMVKRGEAAKAIIAFETAITYGEDADSRNNLAILYYRQGDYDKAIKHLRVLVAYEPGNPSYHYDLAVNLVDKFRNTDDKRLEDLDEALVQYAKAEGLSPGYSHAADNIAVLKKVLGR